MNIGIIGLGLIGGSMAKSFKSRTDYKIYAYDINKSEIYAALLYGAIDCELQKKDINLCDVIIVCTYPKAIIDFVKENAENFKEDALIIDCCGVKHEICEKLYKTMTNNKFNFIGGHPMAGKQYSGFKSSSKHLFKDACMILTPYDETSIEVRERARDLFLEAGFKKVHFTTPEEHDKKIAYTSQLAHVVSNAYIKSPTSKDCKDISAGSYRDMIRVAKLNAPMWTELFLQNDNYLIKEIDLLIEHLKEYSEAIKNKDSKELISLLEEGNLR